MKNEGLESSIKKELENLKQIPGRDPHLVARGKSAYLRQAISLKASQRQNGWINYLFPTISKKERLLVLKPFMALILVITILFAGTAGTVYAAQGSFPGQALYQVKTWSEDVLLAVTLSPQVQLEHNLNFADRRIMEIAYLQAAGTPIPQHVHTRLQAEMNQALYLVAGMDDQQLLMELERIRLRLEAQLQMVFMLMPGDPILSDPVMVMVRTTLQHQLQLASQGKTDIQGFQIQIENQIQNKINLAPSQLPGNWQGGSNYSHTVTPSITPSASGQQNGDGSISNEGNDPENNYLTITPVQNGPYYGQNTPDPGNGNKP